MSKMFLKFFLIFFCVTSVIYADRGQDLVNHVKNCIALAEQKKSSLSDDALAVSGMSGHKVKHFLNNVCKLPNTTYLEIGLFKGSTFVAALYGNESTIDHALGIDLGINLAKESADRLLPSGTFHLLAQDRFTVNPAEVLPLPVTVYFYDGDHAEINQERAFRYFNKIFDDYFVAIVDDWNSWEIRRGTSTAFKKLNYEILFEQEFFTNMNGDPEGWWNGLYIAVIKK
jgi:hypothetical protein